MGLSIAAGAAESAASAEIPVAVTQTQQNDVTRATLANGMRVVIVRDKLAPMVTTQITYLAGSYEAPKAYPGTAHALEHMMFRNSNGLTGGQLDEMVGKMGAQDNAFTTSDATQFYFVAPAQYLDMLLHIEAIRMRSAQLTDKEWGLERGAIEQEVSRDISDPGTLAFKQAERALYAGTGYAEDPLGTRPTFDATTAKVLQSFYNRWYRPNNAILVIAGDVDPHAVVAKVEDLFGSIPSASVPQHAPPKLELFKATTIAKTTPSATGTVQYLFRMPGLQSNDYPAMQVLLDVLGNSRSGLSDLAAQGKVLSADAQAEPFAHGGIGVVEVGFAKGGDSNQAQRYLDGAISDLLETGVPVDLVEAAKRQEKAQYEFNKNSSTDLASSWSRALAWEGVNSPRDALDHILAVTPADVDRVAREYLKPGQGVTVVLTPSPDGQRPPNSSGFGGTESFAGDSKLNSPLPEWAARQLAKLQVPHWTLAPVSMKLPNGITLIVQPAHVSKTVTVVGRIDSNESLQAPKGQEGIDRLLDSLFDYGTTTLNRSAFHKALDEIAATESAGANFSIMVPSENFDKAMRLLADNELHPALPQKAFDAQQRVLSRTLAGELQSPDYKMKRALYKSLYPAGDPALRQATPKTVDGLTLADLAAYYAMVYRPDMTTIAMVGDVTPEQAKVEVEKYFGAWNARGPRPDVIPKRLPVNPASYTVVPNAYASQDQVLIGQMLDLNIHNPARYALQLGNDVLGGNGFASRLMVDVRVNHGYAYGAYSWLKFDRARATFYVWYGSDADKVKPVDQLVLKDLEDMRSAPLNATELLNAKQAEIRSVPLAVSSVDSIAHSLLDWSIKGEPLDEPMVAARHYLGLTASQVQDAYRKYVRPVNLVQVVQGPTPEQH